MADEHDSLISNRSAGSCRDRYRPSCVRSKGAVLTLMLCFFVYTITTILVFLLSYALKQLLSSPRIPPVFGVFAIICLLYPLLGLLGEKWMRYKVISFGFGVLSVNYTILLIILSVFFGILLSSISKYSNIALAVSLAVVVTFCFPGLCLFESNIIQFGTDQLQSAPSEELSSFVHWLCWVYTLPNLFVSIFIMIGLSSHSAGLIASIILLIFGMIFVVAGVFFLCCLKRYMVIEPAQHNNPVKLIWRVMRYAWKHKQPVRRSAFTYGEPPPSRLDLGKERYGGPFTTEQVENVKSFWNITPIVFGSIPFSFVESNLRQLRFSNAESNTERVFLDYPAIIPYTVVFAAIPIHQLLIVPYFSRYIPSMLKRIWIPSMLKRIWIGLVLALVQIGSGLFPTTVHATDHVLIALQFFKGISIMLVFIGSLEFILAQAPRTMQGILVGFWLMQYYFIWNLNELISSYIGNHQHQLFIYYIVITCVGSISVICYTIAACQYKYRQRNEPSEINERIIIEEYTERQIDCSLVQSNEQHMEENETFYNIVSMVAN